MNEVISVYTPGVIAHIEMFTYQAKELQQFVIYTYYNEAGEPLYVGCSKSFYDAHYRNTLCLDFSGEVRYVGFVFFRDEISMKEAKKDYIRARQPKHARHRHMNLPYIKACDVDTDDLVVSVEEMERRWREWLGGCEISHDEWEKYICS